jgi:hypothetical protein
MDSFIGDLKSSKRISALTRLYLGGDKPSGCKGAPDSEPAKP